mmetsp:Transcript_50165/g.130243  ORF Transcript_50165/g.130243 Transcript_50165/m.130243 type:complete len:239 (-) Transcript_50165:2-718(-)
MLGAVVEGLRHRLQPSRFRRVSLSNLSYLHNGGLHERGVHGSLALHRPLRHRLADHHPVRTRARYQARAAASCLRQRINCSALHCICSVLRADALLVGHAIQRAQGQFRRRVGHIAELLLVVGVATGLVVAYTSGNQRLAQLRARQVREWCQLLLAVGEGAGRALGAHADEVELAHLGLLEDHNPLRASLVVPLAVASRRAALAALPTARHAEGLQLAARGAGPRGEESDLHLPAKTA